MAKAGEKIYEWDRHPRMLMTAFQTTSWKRMHAAGMRHAQRRCLRDKSGKSIGRPLNEYS